MTRKTSADIFFQLRDLRQDMIAERRTIERSGMFTGDGAIETFGKTATLKRWQETIDQAEAAIGRHAEVAQDRLAKARAAAVAPPKTVQEQLLAEQRLARKIPFIAAKIEKPGADLMALVSEADPTEVAAIVDHLRDVAASGHPRADMIRAAVDHGIDQRDPAIAEAAAKAQHAEQLRAVAGLQIAGTRRVLESAGARDDSVADAQLANGAADKWDTRLDAA